MENGKKRRYNKNTQSRANVCLRDTRIPFRDKLHSARCKDTDWQNSETAIATRGWEGESGREEEEEKHDERARDTACRFGYRASVSHDSADVRSKNRDDCHTPVNYYIN